MEINEPIISEVIYHNKSENKLKFVRRGKTIEITHSMVGFIVMSNIIMICDGHNNINLINFIEGLTIGLGDNLKFISDRFKNLIVKHITYTSNKIIITYTRESQ